jgi:hypothetical protein
MPDADDAQARDGADGEGRCPGPAGVPPSPAAERTVESGAPADGAGSPWPPLVRVPGADRATLLRRIVGG